MATDWQRCLTAVEDFLGALREFEQELHEGRAPDAVQDTVRRQVRDWTEQAAYDLETAQDRTQEPLHLVGDLEYLGCRHPWILDELQQLEVECGPYAYSLTFQQIDTHTRIPGWHQPQRLPVA